MLTPQPLKKGDKVAVICLSSGVIGEPYCAHEKELGEKKLREMGLEPVFTRHALRGADFILSHPETRAADLKEAFLDDSVKGIITSIGGIETFRTFPYLMEDEEFINGLFRYHQQPPHVPQAGLADLLRTGFHVRYR